MNDLVDLILRSGRWGGAASVLLACGCFAVVWYDLELTGGFFAALPGVGVIALMLGGLLLAFGDPRAPKLPPPDDDGPLP